MILYELTNENYFVAGMLEGRFEKWPEYFRNVLRRRWNEFLRERYGSEARLRQAWAALDATEDLAQGSVEFRLNARDGGILPAPRSADVTRFIYRLFLDYSRELVEIMRAEGVTVPVCLDTLCDPKLPCYYAASEGDFVCFGTYPNQVTSDKQARDFPFRTNLDHEPGFYNMDVANIAGKPMVIYETNIFKPAKFRAEYPWRIAAHAAWQGWDAVFWYLWSNGTVHNQHSPETYVTTGLRYAATSHKWHGIVISTDEVLLAALRTAGAAFLNGHLPVAREPVVIDVGSHDLLSKHWLGSVSVPIPEAARKYRYPLGGAQRVTAFTKGLRFRFSMNRPETLLHGELLGETTPPLQPHPGLVYDWRAGTLTIDTPGAKVAVGRIRPGREFRDGTRLSGVDQDYALFALVSDTPEALSTAENRGVQFDLGQVDKESRHPLFMRLTRSWGKGPPLVQRPAGRVETPRSWRFGPRDFLLRPLTVRESSVFEFVSDTPTFVVGLREHRTNEAGRGAGERN